MTVDLHEKAEFIVCSRASDLSLWGFINRKRRRWQGCVTVAVKPAAVQDALPQFLLIHLLPLCYNNAHLTSLPIIL